MNDTVKTIFGLIGGLALFLYGMNSMSDALQKTAGEKMKKILSFLTKNPIMGALAGALVTAVLQSSSATTVMAIGFVSAGLMTLKQAISVIFGANIGTTITAQLLAFKISNYIYPLIFIGFMIHFVAKNERNKNVGMAIFSFGLLFEGIEIMGEVMKPLAGSPFFVDMMAKVADVPILGVLLGAVMTLVVQSSSATIAVLQNFASQAGPDGVTSVMGLAGAIPILLGDNIGTTITAFLASVGQSKNAKRTAVAHSVFNITGSAVFIFLIPLLSKFVQYISPKGNEADVIARQIANAHTTFNVVCTLVWLPLIPLMVKIVMWIVRGDDTKTTLAYAPKYLDDRMFGQPMAAMYLISNEIERLSGYTDSMLVALKDSITGKGKTKMQENFREQCNIVKHLQESIGTYIATLFTRGTLTETQAEQTAGLLAVTNNISRIADRCQDVEDSYEQILRDGKKLSGKAKDEIADCIEKVAHLFSDAMKSIAEGDASVAEQLTKDKDKMRKVQKKNKKAHLKRVEKKTCNPEVTGNYFNMLYNIDRLADNCTSIMEEAMDHVAYVKLEETGMEQYLEEVRAND